MRTTVRKVLVGATSVLAIALLSQSPAASTDYLGTTEAAALCTLDPPTADVPSACVCAAESSCVFYATFDWGYTINNDIGQACRIAPTQVKQALSAGEPRVGNACSSSPYGG